MIFVCSKTYIW